MKSVYILFILINIKSSFSLINIDLTYTIKPNSPIYPGLTPFNFTFTYESWRQDDLNNDYFVAINTFITSEHYGTHIDAPYHGSNTSWSLEQIPFDRLVSLQGLIIDVSKKSLATSNYQISIEDLNEDLMKETTGYFVLLFYTGKSKYWPDQFAYAGGNTPEELNFPGLSHRLASYLVEKYSNKLVGVGIDTLSIDPGSSKHFHAHRTLFKGNIYALENVASLSVVLKHLSKRREKIFSFDVLPMKIQGGTGAPCRLVAHIDDTDNTAGGWFGFLIFFLLLAIIFIVGKTIYDIRFNPNKDFS